MSGEQSLNRLIDNALTAQRNANSDWGKNYWECVLSDLMRKYKRLM